MNIQCNGLFPRSAADGERISGFITIGLTGRRFWATATVSAGKLALSLSEPLGDAGEEAGWRNAGIIVGQHLGSGVYSFDFGEAELVLAIRRVLPFSEEKLARIEAMSAEQRAKVLEPGTVFLGAMALPQTADQATLAAMLTEALGDEPLAAEPAVEQPEAPAPRNRRERRAAAKA